MDFLSLLFPLAYWEIIPKVNGPISSYSQVENLWEPEEMFSLSPSTATDSKVEQKSLEVGTCASECRYLHSRTHEQTEDYLCLFSIGYSRICQTNTLVRYLRNLNEMGTSLSKKWVSNIIL